MKAVNLLTDARSRVAQKGSGPTGSPGGGRQPLGYVLLGALGLALVAVFLFVGASNQVTEKRAEVARADAAALAAQQRAAALKPYGDFASMASKRVETVSSLARNRFDWEQVLRDLARALPAKVTVTNFEGTVAPGAGSSGKGGAGGSSSPLRASLAVPAVELQGCARSQDDVAILMSRLRNVQGVTRVSLARSDKDRQAGAGASATAGGGGGTGAGVTAGTDGFCGKGTPAFELIVFFENDAAASEARNGAVPGATPAATATPAPSSAQPASNTNGSAP